MMNSAFAALTGVHADYYPAPLRGTIDEINALVYARINNGVYRCGFAGTQAAYERAFDSLFAALDRVEATLGQSRYLAGAELTEADWRLFTTLVRFDAVYYVHFQVQSTAHRAVSELVAAASGAVCRARDCADGEHGSHQATLLFEPPPSQSERHRTERSSPRIHG
jgi:glutathionyl-hydroquinone reductase